jgi:dihydroorotase
MAQNPAKTARMSPTTLSLTLPDDWHLHLRDGDALRTTVPHTATQFGRAIVMPNLKPPVTTVAAALAYRERILAARPAHSNFTPLMTLYLTDSLALKELQLAVENEHVHAIKYYPAGATTNSDNGVTDIRVVYPLLEHMAATGLPLLVHGEVTDSATDIFDREKIFIDTVLSPLLQRLPELRVVLEHITTRDAVQFVSESGANVAATITVHHLLYNRNDLLAGGIRPHYYCLPVLKRNTHQAALIAAATSGNRKFFLGTDSAPHSRATKEHACGCAGVYSAPAALELYAEVFAQENALDKLEGFASFHGPDFYGLPRNQSRIQLQQQEWHMPASFPFLDADIIPIRANDVIRWRLIQDHA